MENEMLKTKRTLFFVVIATLVFTLLPVTVFADTDIRIVDEQPLITIDNKGPKSVSISWYDIVSAKTYKVYRSTSKNGKYKLISTVKKTKYTDKKVKRNKTYYYKIRAYDGKDASNLSPAKKAKASFAKPILTLKKAKTSSINFTWKKIHNASGYQVYYATSKKGKFKKLASTKKTSFTHKKLKKNKSYYYKVRAYTKIGKKTYYSPYSKVAKYTTPKVNVPDEAKLYNIAPAGLERKYNSYGQATGLTVKWKASSKTVGSVVVEEVIRVNGVTYASNRHDRTLTFSSKDKGSDGNYHITVSTNFIRNCSISTFDTYIFQIWPSSGLYTLYTETDNPLEFAGY